MEFPRSQFIQEIQERKLLHQCTDLQAVDAMLAQHCVTAYIGFDCTAPSLHVGSLVGIMLLRRLQKAGHRPIVLMGGGTTKVGDPSGKEESRTILTDDTIANNMKSIRGIFEQFLTFGSGPSDAIMLNNAEWLEELNYLDFLRDYGQHFSVNRMLSMDSVKQRLDREQALSFLEFNYMVLQAYDFVQLSRKYNCNLQMGGSDQWGNIVNGIELGRRLDRRNLFGLTVPLITTASGSKMGKTARGAVWLNSDQLNAYDYWQYWRNTADADVGRFLRLFTDISVDEIVRLESVEGEELNEAKKILATEATRLCHGDDEAKRAANTARQLFEEKDGISNIPAIDMPRNELGAGIPLFDLVRRMNLSKSGGEAKRLIKGRGCRINDSIISSETYMVTLDDVSVHGTIKISAGRKKHILICPSE